MADHSQECMTDTWRDHTAPDRIHYAMTPTKVSNIILLRIDRIHYHGSPHIDAFYVRILAIAEPAQFPTRRPDDLLQTVLPGHVQGPMLRHRARRPLGLMSTQPAYGARMPDPVQAQPDPIPPIQASATGTKRMSPNCRPGPTPSLPVTPPSSRMCWVVMEAALSARGTQLLQPFPRWWRSACRIGAGRHTARDQADTSHGPRLLITHMMVFQRYPDPVGSPHASNCYTVYHNCLSYTDFGVLHSVAGDVWSA